MPTLNPCHGCYAYFVATQTAQEQPHPYIGASHECWQSYSQVLAKEFEDQAYFAIHRVTVDAYAAQHIGDQTDRRARQSVNVHLIALYLYFEKKLPITHILEFLRKATIIKRDWPAITLLAHPTWLTIQDIAPASTPEAHIELVKSWGKSVWDAYKNQHKTIIATYQAL